MYESAEHLKATKGRESKTLDVHEDLSIVITQLFNGGDITSTVDTFIDY